MREVAVVPTSVRKEGAVPGSKRYRVRVAGRIFEGSDTRTLIRSAVAARRSSRRVACSHCGGGIADRELFRFGYCITCIDRAIAVMSSRRGAA